MLKLTVEASCLLKVNVSGAGQQPTVKLQIYDLAQRVTGEWTLDIENGQGEKTIDIQTVSGGVCMLSAEGDWGRAVQRMREEY